MGRVLENQIAQGCGRVLGSSKLSPAHHADGALEASARDGKLDGQLIALDRLPSAAISWARAESADMARAGRIPRFSSKSASSGTSQRASAPASLLMGWAARSCSKMPDRFLGSGRWSKRLSWSVIALLAVCASAGLTHHLTPPPLPHPMVRAAASIQLRLPELRSPD